MVSGRGIAILVLAVLFGCGAENSSEYRTVDVENPPSPSAVEPVSSLDTPTQPETPPEMKPRPPVAEVVTQDSARPLAETELAVSDARPFAVPLPERLPAESVTTSPVATPGSPMPGKIQLLVPEKTFVTEGAEKALRVTFDDIDLLKVLNMDPVPPDVADHLPGWLSGLNGERIRLRGWMFPPSREDGISRFMFVRDNGICCFGRRPQVYDKVAVSLKDGLTTRYIQGRPFDVIGVLSVEADVEDGEVIWLYALSDATVIDE